MALEPTPTVTAPTLPSRAFADHPLPQADTATLKAHGKRISALKTATRIRQLVVRNSAVQLDCLLGLFPR